MTTEKLSDVICQSWMAWSCLHEVATKCWTDARTMLGDARPALSRRLVLWFSSVAVTSEAIGIWLDSLNSRQGSWGLLQAGGNHSSCLQTVLDSVATCAPCFNPHIQPGFNLFYGFCNSFLVADWLFLWCLVLLLGINSALVAKNGELI